MMCQVSKLLYAGVLISATWVLSFSQMLDNREGDAFMDAPFFNQENIRINRIKSIRGSYHFKKPNDKMRSSGLVYGCDFDTLGRMVMHFETRRFLDKVDTVVTYYEYGENQKLKVLRKYDSNAYYAEVYSYNEQGQIIRIEYLRDINKNANALQFIMDKQYLVSFETMTYETFENQEKKTHFNSFGLPFQYTFYYYNNLGYLTEIIENMAVSSGQRKTTFIYNERGLIQEKQHVSTVMGNSSYRITYEYDNLGNLLSSEFYRNGVYTTETQIIYNSKTGLISSLLKRQVETQVITILNFDKYTFYN
jgi:hypothetical protein